MNEHEIYVKNLVKKIIENGYYISVFDTEEIVNSPSNKFSNIVNDLFAVDEEYLYIYEKDSLGVRFGWIHLIYLNESYETIANYTMSLESIMISINDK